MYNEIRDYIDTQIETYGLNKYSPDLFTFEEGIIYDLPDIYGVELNDFIMSVPYPFELLVKQSSESGKISDTKFREECTNFIHSSEIGLKSTVREIFEIEGEQVILRLNSIRHGKEAGSYLCKIQMTFYHLKSWRD